jgi:hypothetical protein
LVKCLAFTGGSGDGNDTKPYYTDYSRNYFTPSKTGTNIARVANFLLNPSMFSKKFMDDKIKEQYEKELQVAKDVSNCKKYWIWPSNWQSIFWSQ